jgi:hypothetical protein
MPKRKEYVIDTNVPIVANQATQAGVDIPIECILACVDEIEQITQNGRLVLDEDHEIFEEYKKHLSTHGQPGQAHVFFKWVYNHQHDPSKVTRVKIHKQGDSYQEFPEHPQLKDFDISDRKFVAVSNICPGKPIILQAVDSKWWSYKDTLKAVGITVHFLCPQYVETKNKTVKSKKKRAG